MNTKFQQKNGADTWIPRSSSRRLLWAEVAAILCLMTSLPSVLSDTSNPHMQSIYENVFIQSGYDTRIRPRHSRNETRTMLKLSLTLLQLLKLNEKTQVLSTKVRIHHQWRDHKLQWNPEEFGNIKTILIDPKYIWTPDVVLYNSAEEFIQLSQSKARVDYNGYVTWSPPAKLESLCRVDIGYFPFDIQLCHFKFGTWTYSGPHIELRPLDYPGITQCSILTNGINMSKFQESAEWDVIDTPSLFMRQCFPSDDPDVYLVALFYIQMRRKPLFYISNLLIPCLCICSTTLLVFYIPAQSGEKVTLGVTVLNTLTVFLLLVVDISPPTSEATPLIGKYLVFTMVLLTLSIVSTLIVLNAHFQAPVVTIMPGWVRYLFMHLLPPLLLMRRPSFAKKPKKPVKSKQPRDRGDSNLVGSRLQEFLDENIRSRRGDHTASSNQDLEYMEEEEPPLPKFTVDTMIGVSSVADHLRRQDERQQTLDEWHYVAYVLDRLFLWLFITAFTLGTLGIMVQSPSPRDMMNHLSPRVVECLNVSQVDCTERYHLHKLLQEGTTTPE